MCGTLRRQSDSCWRTAVAQLRAVLRKRKTKTLSRRSFCTQRPLPNDTRRPGALVGGRAACVPQTAKYQPPLDSALEAPLVGDLRHFIENVASKDLQSMDTSACVKFRVHTPLPGAVCEQLLSGAPYSRSIDGGRVKGRVADMQPAQP